MSYLAHSDSGVQPERRKQQSHSLYNLNHLHSFDAPLAPTSHVPFGGSYTLKSLLYVLKATHPASLGTQRTRAAAEGTGMAAPTPAPQRQQQHDRVCVANKPHSGSWMSQHPLRHAQPMYLQKATLLLTQRTGRGGRELCFFFFCSPNPCLCLLSPAFYKASQLKGSQTRAAL